MIVLGKRSRELMTGLSYEGRVRRAKTRGMFGWIRNLVRINKAPPMFAANTRRDGMTKKKGEDEIGRAFKIRYR